MKAFILEKIANKLRTSKFIKKAIRVDDNLILMQFDKDKYYFDMTKGNSDIYINIEYSLSKKFTAPFDITLSKKFINSKILKVEVNERILTIEVETNLRFKTEINKIQFEFTGRYTNIIILNDKNIVLEALHHIGEYNSFRIVQPNIELIPLPKKEIKEKIFEVENLEKYTKELFYEKELKKIKNLQNSIILKVGKKEKKLQKLLDNLDNEEKLFLKAQKYQKYGDLTMINLYQIKPYQKNIVIEDFEGNNIKIELPVLSNVNQVGNYFYNLSKKTKQKAKNISIERENLESKIQFIQNYKSAVLSAKNISELNIYKPNKKRELKNDNIEQFFVDDFRVMVGKNEKGNIELLKTSKSNDVWMHIKDKTGSHIIIKTAKKQVPIDVLYQGAKLAISFSNEAEGKVDFTKRKNVKVKDGAFVNYVDYDTFTITARNAREIEDDIEVVKIEKKKIEK